MTTAITNGTTYGTHRHRPADAAPEAQKGEAMPAIDDQTNARLATLQVLLANVGRAANGQMHAAVRYVGHLATEQQRNAALAAQLGLAAPPSLLGAQNSEILAHPEIAEELKRHRERERDRENGLANSVRSAMDGMQRPTAELLRFLNFMDFTDFSPTREERPGEDDEPAINPHDKDASGLVWNSHSEFYEMIGQLLAALQQNWLSKYQDAMEKFLEFYEKFSEALDLIEHGTSGYDNEVLVNFDKMEAALRALMADFKLDENALAAFETRSGADAFIKSLGLPGLKVSPETGVPADGKYRVMIDLGAVQEIVTSVEKFNGQNRWDVARYNAWVAKKDGNVEEIKHTSKVLGEKLNEMTQKFDNIVKILSSTIDKITEADMSFVRGL